MEPAVAGDMSATFRNMKFEDEPTPLPIMAMGNAIEGFRVGRNTTKSYPTGSRRTQVARFT